jgi:hypothetical protein
MRQGRDLEKLVSALERVLSRREGVTVKSPDFLPDKRTGQLREHDVIVTFPSAHHKLILAIECRDRSTKVGVPEVEAFHTKCFDTGINKGVIVSSKGFARTALKKAEDKGITCLELAKVDSFNWLLAPGIRVRNRLLLNTNWTFIPEKNIDPKPPAFDVLNKGGTILPMKALLEAARTEFSRIPDDRLTFGKGSVKVRFSDPGLSIRDTTTDIIHPVTQAIVEIDYEVTETVVPFNLVKYTDKDSGRLITDAAVAQVDFGDYSGKFMIVYKEDEGGEAVFVPDKRDDA